MLHPLRLLGSHPAQQELAQRLLETTTELPLLCPHGHVDPSLLADPKAKFPDPVELFLRPDHYLLRMLYSQGIEMERLLDKEADPKSVWSLFAQNYHLFAGTPSGVWLDYQLAETFGLTEPLTAENADSAFDELQQKLDSPEYTPRALYQRFGIELLCTTDAATDDLRHHRALRSDPWPGQVLPTFRPDRLLWTAHPNWLEELQKLESLLGRSIHHYGSFLEGLQSRRQEFKRLGATATDHGCETAYTELLSGKEAEQFFQLALVGRIKPAQARRLQGHLLIEMARMSREDGLVMQIHAGSLRNHNQQLFAKLGPDKGADIPTAAEFTQNLRPLLNEVGNDPELRILVFTLDESCYARELAPLAGHYPALRLGPPWWFHDSVNGMLRYLDQVVETAGIYNLAGFNDDTRAFCSIPARHDVWRRTCSRWLSGQVLNHVFSEEAAVRLLQELVVGRVREAYKLPEKVTA